MKENLVSLIGLKQKARNSMERLTIRSKNSDMVWFKDAENGNAHLEPCEMDAHHSKIAIKELAKYEDAEEQGLLLRLPCEVGAVVFEIVELLECKYDYECPFDDLYDVNKCEDPDRTCENEYTSHIVIEKKFDISMLDKIGKNVFLEKEDAENKLKEMEE